MNRIKPSTTKAILLLTLHSLTFGTRSIGATWQGSDDFSSGLLQTNWTVQQTNQGQMTAVGTNGHVSFLVPGSAMTEQNAYILWHGQPTAAEDWMVDITGHNSAPYSTQSSSQLQLAVADTLTLNSELRAYRVSQRAATDASFSAGLWIGSGTTIRANIPAIASDFMLRLVYHAATQQIESWYDPTASGMGWLKLDAVSLAEFSPTMASTNTFTFALLSNTYYGPISEGDIWADNFRLMPTPPQLLISGAQTLSGMQVLHLTWPNNGSSVQLQSTSALTQNWSNVVTPWTTNAGWLNVSVTNAASAQFYRLQSN